MDLANEFGMVANLPYYAAALLMAGFALWIRATGRASLARARTVTTERALDDVRGSLRDWRARRARRAR